MQNNCILKNLFLECLLTVSAFLIQKAAKTPLKYNSGGFVTFYTVSSFCAVSY